MASLEDRESGGYQNNKNSKKTFSGGTWGMGVMGMGRDGKMGGPP